LGQQVDQLRVVGSADIPLTQKRTSKQARKEKQLAARRLQQETNV